MQSQKLKDFVHMGDVGFSGGQMRNGVNHDIRI